jgi:lactate permease
LFHQLLTPVGSSLALSFAIATLPIAVVLVLLGVFRRAAWQACLAGLLVALVLATLVWKLPLALALDSTAAGATFALWPVSWIVFSALLLHNIAVQTGRFAAFQDWVIDHLPNDRRVVLVVIGFCFGALLEGVAGFGTPVAITSALLIALGFSALEAVTFTLIFNTAPVAFGALGTPITTLAQVTQLPDHALAAMVGRQLPFLAVLLPFYVVAIYGGFRSVRALWPILLVAGGSFALAQFVTSNYLNYALTDVLASLTGLVVTVAFVKLWRPAPDPAFALNRDRSALRSRAGLAPWQGWLPWIVLAAVVIVWTTLKFSLVGQKGVVWPGLDKEVFIELYQKPYAAIWNFQPLGTGTAIMVAAIITAVLTRVGLRGFLQAARNSFAQVRLATLTVMLTIGLAYLMNYSGITYTLGIGVASAGVLFPLLSAFLGWVAVFLSGSDTSGNALFGNLQVVAAHKLDLQPVLFAATNSSGGVMGKMISPQNISTGTAMTELKGREGMVLARVFWHSVALTFLLGILVMLQQHFLEWMVPK